MTDTSGQHQNDHIESDSDSDFNSNSNLDLQQPNEAFDAQFQQFFLQLNDLQNNIVGLQHFLQVIQQRNNIFDEEDRQCVEQTLFHFQTKFDLLKAELDQRQHLYDTKVKSLEQTIKERSDSLKELDEQFQVLENNPDLMQRFVKKQQEMHRMLDIVKQQLNEPLSVAENPPSRNTPVPVPVPVPTPSPAISSSSQSRLSVKNNHRRRG